tara:strand:+ start:6731 stop:6889 length:159 start_codon:yes stop_codon:yes gene_type:complete
MKLTLKQVEKIQKKLNDYKIDIVDANSNYANVEEISLEYLWEKINEALEEEE